MWQCEHKIEINASTQTIWRLWSDVLNWPRWNAGIETIEMRGPFIVGSEFLMTPPDQEPVLSRLIKVIENEMFADQTVVGEVTVLVTHRIECVNAGRAVVVYTTEVTGPDAAAIGVMVSADFPEVLRALAILAEASSVRDSALLATPQRQ